MKYEDIKRILKEYDVSDAYISALEPYILHKGYVFGFAEIQIDNEPMGQREIENELKQIGIDTYAIFCYESNPAEDLPEDWFEDYNMKFVFVGPCKSIFDAKSKLNQTSYILEIHKIY